MIQSNIQKTHKSRLKTYQDNQANISYVHNYLDTTNAGLRKFAKFSVHIHTVYRKKKENLGRYNNYKKKNFL